MDSPVLIDLSQWTAVGKGMNGCSYHHVTDPGVMIKFMNEDGDSSVLVHELENARKVYSLGIPTSRPGRVVTDGKRIGIELERMPDKISYARAIGQEPERIPEFALRYTELVRGLHSTECPSGLFPDIKEYDRQMILKNPFHTEEQKRFALSLLDRIPDGTTCVHGDLHSGNVIMSAGRSFFIDLGNFCYGHPFNDLAMQHLLNEIVPPGIQERDFHNTKDQSCLFWEEFIKDYSGVGFKDVEEELAPYMVLRLVTMESESGFFNPSVCNELFHRYSRMV